MTGASGRREPADRLHQPAHAGRSPGGRTCTILRPRYTNPFQPRTMHGCAHRAGDRRMVEPMTIDLKALLLEREDCDAGTVQQIRNGLAQGGAQYRTLRDVTEAIKKKLEAATGAAAKRWHLKLGVASFFLGYTAQAVEHLKQAEGSLASFYLGRALASRHDYDEALKAFEKAEKLGYTASQVQLQRAGIYRQKGDLAQARSLLAKLEQQSSHNAEYHFQLASCYLAEGERAKAVTHLEKAVELDPGHTSALFQLGPRQRPGRQRRRRHPATTSAASSIRRSTSARSRTSASSTRTTRNTTRRSSAIAACWRPTRPTSRPGCSTRTPRPRGHVLQPRGGARLQPLQPGAGDPRHRLRAVGAQPQLPEEDEHPHARRPDARQRAAAAEQQELRRNLAERDQGDAGVEGPAASANRWRRAPRTTCVSGRSRR